MKIRPVLAIVATTSLLTAIPAHSQAVPVPVPSGPVEVNGIAAKVNGRVITKNQVSFMLAPLYAQLATKYPRRGPKFEQDMKKAKDEILKELIDRQIILDEFKQIGAEIKPHVVDEEIDRQMHELYAGDEAKFREELKRSRLTMEGYREMTREKLVVQAMRAQQFNDAPPPLPDEVRAEYNKVKNTMRDTSKDVITFRKIFIPASDPNNPLATPDSQLELAEKIAKQLESGEDFAELAKKFSKDAYAEDGGLQEDVPRTDLAPEFAAILFDTPEGSIAGPLLDPAGFTIIKPVDIQYGPAPPLGEVRKLIEESVRKQKSAEQYDRWIESRRKRAMIDVRI